MSRGVDATCSTTCSKGTCTGTVKLPPSGAVPLLCGVNFSTQLMESAHEVHPAAKAQRDRPALGLDGAYWDVRRIQVQPQNEGCRARLNSWKHGLLLLLKPPRRHSPGRRLWQAGSRTPFVPSPERWSRVCRDKRVLGRATRSSVSWRVSRPCLKDSQEL